MKKEKKYDSVRFTADVLANALDELKRMVPEFQDKFRYLHLAVGQRDGSCLYHDSIVEFMSDYRVTEGYANFIADIDSHFELSLTRYRDYCGVSVKAKNRQQIESVFSFFDASASSCEIPKKENLVPQVVVFIGHGRSADWRDLKDHLQDKHGYKIEAYETGARAGHTIRDILEDMLKASSFAILVMTSEDEQADGSVRARQNVIHEAGLFQGRLGFPRAIILLERGVEEFSNVQGVQYIPFSRGNIKECFGEILATLRREFPRQ